MRRSALGALAAYVVCRAVLGAALNPLYNGPDESGHVEYVRTLSDAGQGGVAGPEARQLPTYYALAVLPWRLTAGQPEATRVFAVRLLSGIAGGATLTLTWLAARRLWPAHPAIAWSAACAILAPGHLFVLSSAGNDPLATSLAGASLLAALPLSLDSAGPGRWSVWLLLSLLALTAKPTTLPVVAAEALVLAVQRRRTLLRPWWTRTGLAAGCVLAGAANVALALREPTSSATAALARFWPVAVIRAPVAYIAGYVAGAGLLETFRTWWYGYDYSVRWPRALELAAALCAAAICALALAGLALALTRRARTRIPGIVWACAGAQIVFVLVRYGFGDVLQIEMGGAAQAKAFFPALVPLALLFGAVLDSAGSFIRVPPRWLTPGLFACLLALDAISLSLTLWHHYRWLQLAA